MKYTSMAVKEAADAAGDSGFKYTYCVNLLERVTTKEFTNLPTHLRHPPKTADTEGGGKEG